MCALLRHCAAYSGNSLTKFRDNSSVPSSRVKKCFLGFLALEDGTDKLSRNVGKELPLYAAQYGRRAHISNVVEPDILQTKVRRMSIACCVHKATNTHSVYVIFIAFPLLQWLHERASMLRYTEVLISL